MVDLEDPPWIHMSKSSWRTPEWRGPWGWCSCSAGWTCRCRSDGSATRAVINFYADHNLLSSFQSIFNVNLLTRELSPEQQHTTLPSSWGAACWGRWGAWWSTRRGWTRPPATVCTWSCLSPSACSAPGAWLGWRSQCRLSEGQQVKLRLRPFKSDSMD